MTFDFFAERLDIARMNSETPGARDAHMSCPSCGSADNFHVTEKGDNAIGVCFGCEATHETNAAQLGDAPMKLKRTRKPKSEVGRQKPSKEDPLACLAEYCGVSVEHVRSLPVEDGGTDEPVFTYPSGARKIRRWTDGAKYTWDKDIKPRPVWPVEDEVPETAWFTEGETDAIVLRSLGVTAYSLGSTSDSKSVDTEVWDALKERGLGTAIIAGDADTPGREASSERAQSALSAGLGIRLVAPPGYDPLTGANKDWRAWHLAGGKDLPDPADTTAIVSMSEYLAKHEDETIRWAIEGLAFYGGVSLLAGPMKGGKTTLLENALRTIGTGDLFLGRWDVDPRLEAALFTEEGAVTVRHNLGHLDIHVVSKRDRIPAAWTLAEAVSEALDWIKEHPNALVVFDTYDKWARIKEENSVGENVAAIQTFYALAEAGAAVLLVHHSRKGGGEYGEGIRGSGAILGAVDHAVELKYIKPTDDCRYLEWHGRVLDNDRRTLSFDRTAGKYSLIDAEDIENAALLGYLEGIPRKADDKEGVTRQDIEKVWGISNGRKRITLLLDAGVLTQSDEMVKEGRGKAWRYWRSDIVIKNIDRGTEA